MQVKCPRCGKEIEYRTDNPYRPFCSKRCKESDLYGWLTEDDGESAGDDDGEDGDLPGSDPRTRH